ncbi:TetR/AcrR family transcriptional regulator [Bacillus pseudomycoides]|uniref:TetR/AcrR family transcriptional regulator n=1 Tax=Bacillus pseudomycoides TaxID=64104 RepID=A0AAJ1YYG7_9BACI|nr:MULTISPECIES: TetR/AcrR family transcriptional regulator [Bacillus]MBJ8028938.1 TetR/AcrR family transcriptional regulator [Bacillus cereus group sp. N21]MCR8856814.1 TetR/AcrR family transcriptional regulator [Bacillus pseudomycoides]MCX2827921.1 TetR/AcrR family transcriptional regulator [Bacillus sp. DHT2]MDR4188929.1 TetR/AcrR family transcriptional regulator [Bacillus pseudomycoides]MDR4325802.1 TetR/AcrR family transcriptional regulator [Bacillus pseudomycoides]
MYILNEVIVLNGFEKVKEKKKRAIKDAALSLFSERGFNEVKIEDIAKKAKVSQVTIYNHFGSKDALFRELIHEFATTEFQFYQEIAAENMTFQEMFHKMMRRKMESGSLFHPDMLLQVIQKDPELREFIYRYQNETVLPWFLEILENAQRQNEINPNLSKEMILLYIQMFSKFGEDYGVQLLEDDREKHIKDIITMFFYGLSNPENVTREN